MAHIETTYYVGQGPLTQFTPRDENGVALVEGNFEKVDVVAERRKITFDDDAPLWVDHGLTGVFRDPPSAWDLDAAGYNFEHRIAWGATDERGVAFEPPAGCVVDVYYFLHRAGKNPVVVHHAVSIAHAPVP
jgi:hypothetical protein